MDEALLVARGLSKRFGGLQALKDVSLTINKGNIFGIIGPNGAGKTTLFNVLTGLYAADSGELCIDNINIVNLPSHKIVKHGIARTFQNIRLFGQMTTLENVMVGRHCRTQGGVIGAVFNTKKSRFEEAQIKQRAMELLEYVGIKDRAAQLSSELSYGDQRRLEIARALATEPKLLALDEPAAGMNHSETDELRLLILKIRNDGITVLLIEHDVKLVMGLCDTVAVLDYGQKIAEGIPTLIQKDPKVIEAYLGVDTLEIATNDNLPKVESHG